MIPAMEVIPPLSLVGFLFTFRRQDYTRADCVSSNGVTHDAGVSSLAASTGLQGDGSMAEGFPPEPAPAVFRPTKGDVV